MVAKLKVRKKKKLGSYPYFTVIFSITLALIVLGLFGLLLIHTSKLSNIVKQSFEIQVFLNKNLSHNQKSHISGLIQSKPYIAKDIEFISKEEAAEKFIKETGEDFTQFLGANPLRDALILRVKPEYTTPQSLAEIKVELQNIQGVFEVEYIESLIASINQNVQKISLVLLGFAVILILVIFILINNTIKLALFSQRFIIRSMQLVGATSWFIQRPFLWRAIWQGLLAGFLSIGILYGSLNYAYGYIEELRLLEDIKLFLLLGAVLLITGSLIGFLSSFRAIRRYLRLSLDELY